MSDTLFWTICVSFLTLGINNYLLWKLIIKRIDRIEGFLNL